MKLEVNDLENSVKQISLNGRLDIQGTGEIENAFIAHSASKKAGVLVDMSGVEFIASIGMRFLVSCAKALAGRGGKMVLLKPTPLVKDALETAGIDTLIPIYADFDAASAALHAAVSA